MAASQPAGLGTAVERLDVYAGGLVTEAPQLPVLATISAGRKAQTQDGRSYPTASQHGEIVLHDAEGQAPGLAAELERHEGKRLLVAFPFSDTRLFIQSRFKRYSAGGLQVYGDALSVTEIVLHETGKDTKGRKVYRAEHVSYPHGTEEYERLVASCKVETSVLFVLARWEGGQARLWWPDGFGLYRLRTTSRHTLRSIAGSLALVAQMTGGRLAGVPFELSLGYPEVARPTGERQKVPVWRIVFRPPQGIELTGPSFTSLVGRALGEAEALRALPAPSVETLEAALAEPEAVDLARLEAGDVADVAYWRSRWHALARGTWYASPAGRAEFLRWFTEGATDSLATFLASATNDACEQLCTALAEALADHGSGPLESAVDEELCRGCGVAVRAAELDEGYCADCLGQYDDEAAAAEAELSTSAGPGADAPLAARSGAGIGLSSGAREPSALSSPQAASASEQAEAQPQAAGLWVDGAREVARLLASEDGQKRQGKAASAAQMRAVDGMLVKLFGPGVVGDARRVPLQTLLGRVDLEGQLSNAEAWALLTWGGSVRGGRNG